MSSSLNSTPSSERVHIGFFGRRNAGKSSLVNRITGQDLSVVSDVPGTTTDPVWKAMELLPLGPVEIIDTPGYDDEGMLGHLRIRKTLEILRRTDIAVLVIDGTGEPGDPDRELIRLFREHELPFLIVINKSDLAEPDHMKRLLTENANPEAGEKDPEIPIRPEQIFGVSALDGRGISALKEAIAGMAHRESRSPERRIIADRIRPSDLVILVIPIDESAPKGRLILPQQQTIRDILDTGAAALTVREHEYSDLLHRIGIRPALVVTDSQVFEKISAETPEDIPLTSFSILFARYKGDLGTAVSGVRAIHDLRDSDTVLISEGCTHHRQCGDIGSVKIPRWIRESTDADIRVELSSGREFPDDLSKYRAVIHCGGCMLNEREMKYRQRSAVSQGIPITNYGIAIADMKGILPRCIRLFADELL